MQTAILGISAFYHDSAAVLVVDGEIVAAAQEERFSRRKHDSSFPTQAVRYVLDEADLSPEDLAGVAFYDKPLLKFERLLETYHGFAPKGLKSFATAIPVWIREKLFLRRQIREGLTNIGPGSPPIFFPEHHLSHAASAFYPSPFASAAILTVDGVGEWATTVIGLGRENGITFLRELRFPHSLGLLYSAFTAYCGFKVNSGEYKLMGLAPYGHRNSERVERLKGLILDEMVDVRSDGSFLLNMSYLNYATGLSMFREVKWRGLLDMAPRQPEEEIGQEYMDLALAIQEVTEEIVLRLANTARELTGSDYLVMAGGVALNCVANGRLLKSGLFKDIWIQPAAGDAGGALGAALATASLEFGSPRSLTPGRDAMYGAYLGPDCEERDVRRVVRRHGAPCVRFRDSNELCRRASELLADGRVVGWFQGRMEFGPRALGNRSILADPRQPDMQRRLNLKIKFREGFRPFAPAVLEEDCKYWFELDRPSPYMLLVAPVRPALRCPLPSNYESLDLYERLAYPRSSIPAVTHIDFSARVQSVSANTNPLLWELISSFKDRTSCPVLVNTSFNVRGEPIVCTPQDAYICFMRTGMDVLVLGDRIFLKEEQPTWNEGEGWRSIHELD